MMACGNVDTSYFGMACSLMTLVSCFLSIDGGILSVIDLLNGDTVFIVLLGCFGIQRWDGKA